MLNKNKRGKLFTRRVFFLAGFKASLFMTLIGRLYYLQVVKSDEYKTFSDSNSVKLTLIPPFRGKILDKDGRVLAENRNYYRILFDTTTAESADEAKGVIQRVVDILKFDEKKHQRILSRFEKRNPKRPVLLYDELTWEEVAKIEVNIPDLPGISIDVGQNRSFPLGPLSAHVIGYMGPVSEQEIATNPLLNHPDFKIGRSGIEKAFEQKLRGVIGVRRMEVDAHGRIVRELSREEGKPGKDLSLTIDRRLQEFASNRIKDVSGCTSVVDITTGDILAFASNPSFDPNEFTYGVDADYWKKLMGDEKKPLISKIISNQYPPGSTFKPMVALASLKDGVDPETTVFCPGYVVLGSRRFHCWKEEGHGNMNMKQAIMHSCNSYFFTMAKRIGESKIAEMARYFGLGKETGIILSGEKPGLIPDDKWKRSRYNIPWQMGDTLNFGIGQGYVLSTPLQLMIMSARIASGKMVTTHLVEEDRKEFEDLNIPKAHLDIIRDGMTSVVNVQGGTAYASRILDKAYSMAGKTGTSQVISKKGLKENADRMTKAELDKTKNHALFIGFGPLEKPKYAISVIVEHGIAGSVAAAPIGRDVMEEVQKLNAENKLT